jgi:hypothetical protein
VRIVVPFLAAMCLGLSAGCTPFGEQEVQSLIDAADATYQTLPAYPGAKQTEHDTSVGHEDEGGPVTQGLTLYVFRLPATATVDRVERFYTTRLSKAGWNLVERIPDRPRHKLGPVLNFKRGRMRVSINLEGGYGHRLEVAVSTLA